MDKLRLALLLAEVQEQQEKINQMYLLVEARAAYMRANSPAYVESTAYQLHNLYNAIEYLMEIVAKAFENSVTDLSRWHTQLLDRMGLQIDGIRPALFSEEVIGLLHELRAFRHFFRHAYGIPLDYVRVEQVLFEARELQPLLKQDIQVFVETLKSEKQG